MGFFVTKLVVIIVGSIVHIFFDHSPRRRTTPRVLELLLVWVLAAGGVFTIIGGIEHLGPNSTDVAEDIGFAPSFFQWEVGWADVAVGSLGVLCIWNRDSFMTATVIAVALSMGGDAIGHVMQYVSHDNTATDNAWGIVNAVIPIAAVTLLFAYRRSDDRVVTTSQPGP